MSGKESAGLIMYRQGDQGIEIFLAHHGGPFFKNKDEGSWTIPKGLIEAREDPLEAAKREFEEETGIKPASPFIPLGDVKQKGGKRVLAWAFRGNIPEDYEPDSNFFKMEWPPHSGQKQSFPEIDKAEFFTVEQAKKKINQSQIPFIDRLQAILSGLDPDRI